MSTNSSPQQRDGATRKFFALRDSGYRGPIDQGGNPVTSGPAVEILAALNRAQARRP